MKLKKKAAVAPRQAIPLEEPQEESTPGVETLEAVPVEIAMARQIEINNLMRERKRMMQRQETRELVAGLRVQLDRVENALELLERHVTEVLSE